VNISKKKKFGPTPDGGEILVKVQISVAIMCRKRSPSSEFDLYNITKVPGTTFTISINYNLKFFVIFVFLICCIILCVAEVFV
jgi:hypothetical protein